LTEIACGHVQKAIAWLLLTPKKTTSSVGDTVVLSTRYSWKCISCLRQDNKTFAGL